MRLSHSRGAQPDPASLQGFDPVRLEGDVPVPTPDAISSLRPFGRDVPAPFLGPEIPAGTAPADRPLASARALLERGRRLEAILVLEQAVHERPDDVPSRALLADALARTGELEAAIEHLTAALARTPNRADLLTARGAFHAQQGRTAEAERDLQAAARSDPTYWLAYRYLGSTRLRRGVPDDAVPVLRQAVRLAPDDPDAGLALGEALSVTGATDEALTILEGVAARHPKDPRPWTLMGRLFDRWGRSDDAMAMHRRAREISAA